MRKERHTPGSLAGERTLCKRGRVWCHLCNTRARENSGSSFSGFGVEGHCFVVQTGVSLACSWLRNFPKRKSARQNVNYARVWPRPFEAVQ